MGERGFWFFTAFVVLVSVCLFSHSPTVAGTTATDSFSIHWYWTILLSAIMLPLVMLYVRFLFTQQRTDLNDLKKDVETQLDKMDTNFRGELKELKKEAKERDEALKNCILLKADVATLDRFSSDNREAHRDIWRRVHGHKHDEKGLVVITTETE